MSLKTTCENLINQFENEKKEIPKLRKTLSGLKFLKKEVESDLKVSATEQASLLRYIKKGSKKIKKVIDEFKSKESIILNLVLELEKEESSIKSSVVERPLQVKPIKTEKKKIIDMILNKKDKNADSEVSEFIFPNKEKDVDQEKFSAAVGKAMVKRKKFSS